MKEYGGIRDIGEERNRITEAVIGCAYRVGNTLGCGFLEKVYENALAHEMKKAGLSVSQQHEIPVFYDGIEVGYFVADMLVEGCVLVELKAVNELNDIHLAQCLNYLKSTGLEICLLMNFAKARVDVRRVVATGLKGSRKLDFHRG